MACGAMYIDIHKQEASSKESILPYSGLDGDALVLLMHTKRQHHTITSFKRICFTFPNSHLLPSIDKSIASSIEKVVLKCRHQSYHRAIGSSTNLTSAYLPEMFIKQNTLLSRLLSNICLQSAAQILCQFLTSC